MNADNPKSAAHDFAPQAGETIRAKWVMDGATTLAEAAERLERFAADLRSAHDNGWTLTAPVQDDYGFLRSPQGDAGWIDDEEPIEN